MTQLETSSHRRFESAFSLAAVVAGMTTSHHREFAFENSMPAAEVPCQCSERALSYFISLYKSAVYGIPYIVIYVLCF